jgi:predicted phosphodiesterase
MIDIFVEEKPKLYIADVYVVTYAPERKGSKKIRKIAIGLEKVPIVLLNGDFPTKNSRKRFMKRVFDQYIIRGDFDKVRFEVESISNVKFSSELAYNFDFNTH